LIYHIRLFDNSISETMLTAQFLLGLMEDIRAHVDMMLPDSVAKAATLASIQRRKFRRVIGHSVLGDNLLGIRLIVRAQSLLLNYGRLDS
jgi:hypothetical protein